MRRDERVVLTVPFRSRREGDAMIVEAVLNEKFKARLLVDTGASDSWLLKRYVKKCGLPTERDAKGEFVRLDHVALGDSEAEGEFHVEPDRADTDHWYQSMDGVLGANWLGQSAVYFDHNASRLLAFVGGRLAPEEVAELGLRPSSGVKLRRLPGGRGAYTVSAAVDGGPTEELLLDTGCNVVCLPETYRGMRDKPVIWRGKLLAESANTNRGVDRSGRVVRAGVRVGGVSAEDVPVGLVNEAFLATATPPLPGMLGTSFLSRTFFCVDYAAETLYLRKR